MAILTYNGTNFDNWVGSAAFAAANTNLTTTGITSAATTAPSLINHATGCWIYINSIPASPNTLTIALLESGVSKVTAVMNFADMQLGLNYVRFTVPYLFTTLTASSYTVKATTSSSNSGSLRNATSGFWFEITYDSAVSIGSTDDIWVPGFQNAGMTPQTFTLSGTSNLWGSGTDKAVSGAVTATMGAGITIGNGGIVKFDTSASTTLQLRGSIFVMAGGLFDMRGSSTKSRVNKLIWDCETANGNYGIFSSAGGYGGQILTNSAATWNRYTTYASGLGTAASPLIVQTGWDADVGDEIIIGGGTGYDKNETRYIITRNSSTSFVVSSTPGGAETALANTHTAGTYMSNLQSNVIMTALTTTRGYWIQNSSISASPVSAFDYTRFEYASCTSGNGLTLASASNPATMNGIVLYNSPVAGRGALLFIGITTARTYDSIVTYNLQGTNFSGQSGIQLQTCSNVTLSNCFNYNANAGILNCGFISFITTSVNNTINNCHSYGANAVNSASGYAIGIFASSGNIFNNCTINGTRTNGVLIATGSNNIFNNCSFGTVATNTIDIQNVASSLNTATFNSCNFGSATLVATYTTLLEGSLIGFQNYNGGTTSHRWYTNHGSGWSAGAGLTDTTVRTASSLSLVLKPEDATNGASWTHYIPANSNTNVFENGYVYRNPTFSSGTVKVELWLPTTLLSSAPDATYTFPTTAGSWLPYLVSAYYSGSVSGLATVKITAVTATSGAYLFVDDLYDAALNNKLAGIDIWVNGQPSPLIAAVDASAVPGLVWNYPSTPNTSGTKGEQLTDAADNAELAAIK
mgnify:CR=1 FL=1